MQIGLTVIEWPETFANKFANLRVDIICCVHSLFMLPPGAEMYVIAGLMQTTVFPILRPKNDQMCCF